MIRTFLVFLLAIYTTNVFAGRGGNIGQRDDRSYGSLSDPNYHGVVKLTINGGRCTGGFISKNLIITNDHCAVLCKNGCSADFWNGSGYERASLKILAYFKNHETLKGNDWAVLLSDKQSPFYKFVAPHSTPGQIIRGGFGTLRIIEDDEIPFLKNLYAQTKKEFGTECKKKQEGYTPCINAHVDKKLKEMGKKPLLGDSNNFKIQTCKILGDHPESNRMVKTDCDSAGGDSGAPLLRGGQIVGLNNSGPQNIFNDNESNGANAVKTENFYNYVQKYIKDYENTSIVNNTNNNSGATQTNTSPNQNVGNSTNVYEDPQQIQQVLQQRLQEFNCD